MRRGEKIPDSRVMALGRKAPGAYSPYLRFWFWNKDQSLSQEPVLGSQGRPKPSLRHPGEASADPVWPCALERVSIWNMMEGC